MPFDQAVGLIRSAKQGTGYMVSSTLMVTCEHVVGDAEEVTVRIAGKELTAKVKQKDKSADIAAVEFTEPVPVEPLQLAAGCPEDTKWRTYGFPGIAKGTGIPMMGYVAQAEGMDSLGQAAVVLFADQVQGEGPTVSGFSGSPVLVNGMVVGTIKRILENPDRKGWPLYGLVWATPSRDILSFLKVQAAGEAQAEAAGVDRMSGILAALDRVILATEAYRLWNELQETGVVEPRVSLKAARVLMSKGRPELADEVLRTAGDSVEAQILSARVLGDLGKTEKAVEVLSRLRDEGKLDADSTGVLAGRYRELWEESNYADTEWRTKSYETYLQAWKASRLTYCGVNASAMALMEGKFAESSGLAWEVKSDLEKIPEPALSAWDLASFAEAYLLLREEQIARQWYQKAKAKAAGNDRDIAVMWRGAVRALRALGKDEKLLNDVLRPRAVCAFFGHSVDRPGQDPPRFPPGRQQEVRAAIAAQIAEHDIGYGVCSACRGSDLLFLDELIKHKGKALVVLTHTIEEFQETFIGATWQHVFEEARASGRVELRILDGSPQVWKECRSVIRSEVRRYARSFGCPSLLVAVWDGVPGSYVADAVDEWNNSNDPVATIPLGTAAQAAGG